MSMSKLHFTTKHANAASVQRKWYVVDGTNQTVGRISSKIASVLRGKNKAYYTPHVDCGDFVIIINADKVKFTGNKMDEKEYQTIILAVLLHDIGKAITYKKHGEISLQLANKYIELNEIEQNAIKYHMGMYGSKKRNVVERRFFVTFE